MSTATLTRTNSRSLSNGDNGLKLPGVLSALAQNLADEARLLRERRRLEALTKRYCYENAEPESQIGFLKISATRSFYSSPCSERELAAEQEMREHLEGEIRLANLKKAAVQLRRRTPK